MTRPSIRNLISMGIAIFPSDILSSYVCACTVVCRSRWEGAVRYVGVRGGNFSHRRRHPVQCDRVASPSRRNLHNSILDALSPGHTSTNGVRRPNVASAQKHSRRVVVCRAHRIVGYRIFSESLSSVPANCTPNENNDCLASEDACFRYFPLDI